MKVDVLEITSWETPASKYEKRTVGDYALGKHVYKPGYYSYHGIEGYTLFYLGKPIETTTLLQKRPGRFSWREWMVDSPTDYRAMQLYANQSSGKVLTTGLGLGLVTQELVKNPAVESVTVVELSPNVVELVTPYLPESPKIHIVNQNFWDFVKEDKTSWDYVIVDIWVYYGRDQQIDQYKREIMPASILLGDKYPGARIFFHGFAGMPTVEQIDQAVQEGLDVDKLIYGLGGV